ncbi:Uncharacterised protein [Mycobacteroides abscessus subsp. abscessus]|nr:Uncharacterised protein [Mycobacteroides abscessus subsp. abscessus]
MLVADDTQGGVRQAVCVDIAELGALGYRIEGVVQIRGPLVPEVVHAGEDLAVGMYRGHRRC